MAAVVDDGGATKELEDYLKWLAKKILEGAAILLPAGCAAPPEPESYRAVAVYCCHYRLRDDGWRHIYTIDAVRQLKTQIEDLRRKYPEYPNILVDIEKTFEFTYGDDGSLRAKLEKFGKGSITWLFIFGHGITLEYGGKADPYSVYVAGIRDELIVETCMPYMKPPAWVRLTGCFQRNARWEQLSRDGVKFGCSPAFEGEMCDVRNGFIDMHNRFWVTIDGEEVGPEWKEPKMEPESLEDY